MDRKNPLNILVLLISGAAVFVRMCSVCAETAPTKAESSLRDRKDVVFVCDFESDKSSACMAIPNVSIWSRPIRR